VLLVHNHQRQIVPGIHIERCLRADDEVELALCDICFDLLLLGCCVRACQDADAWTEPAERQLVSKLREGVVVLRGQELRGCEKQCLLACRCSSIGATKPYCDAKLTLSQA
jgi:hypothetical protein